MARLKYHQTILKILGHDHLTADDIYDIMKKKYGRIGIATIYRTLDYLLENGEITKLVGVFDKAYFEIQKGLHIHFVDKQMRTIIDMPIADYSFLPKQEGFSVSYADVVVYGSIDGKDVSSGLFSDPSIIQPQKSPIIHKQSIKQNNKNNITNNAGYGVQNNEVLEESNENGQSNLSIDAGVSIANKSPSQAEIQVELSIDSSLLFTEDLEQKQKDEEKKKRKELKNIFRQF